MFALSASEGGDAELYVSSPLYDFAIPVQVGAHWSCMQA